MSPEAVDKVDSVYMIGIGGIGMSALARYFLLKGKSVKGYDRVSTRLTDDLIREGSEIHITADLAYIKDHFLPGSGKTACGLYSCHTGRPPGTAILPQRRIPGYEKGGTAGHSE
jgi:hypothetical protein